MTIPNPSGLESTGKQTTQAPIDMIWLVIVSASTAAGILAGIGYAFFALQTGNWPFYLIGALYFLAGLLGIPGILQIRSGRFQIRQMGLVTVFLAIAGIAQSFFIKSSGLPSAVIFLIYSLILTSALSAHRSGSQTITLGLFASALMSLTAIFSPYATLQAAAIDRILISVLGLLVMIYIAMLAVQYISSTLQIRLTTAFIAIVIVSLSIVTIIQGQISIAEQRANISNNVTLTSSQVSTNLDNFIDTNMKALMKEAQVDPVINYLEAKNSGAVPKSVEQDVNMVFRLLQFRETSERVYLSSYGLLDQDGINVLDTNEANIGIPEGNQVYFSAPLRTGQPYVSDVFFASNGYSYVYFSAPVKNAQRQNIGVLRVRYNALVFQRVLQTYSGLLGVNSYAMLFDENMLRLADTFTPNMVYSTVINLSRELTNQLESEHRLPTRPDMKVVADLPELARAIQNSDRNRTFNLNLESASVGSANPLQEIGGISSMIQKPWKVVYLISNFDDTPIREGQIRTATLIATIIAFLVGIISVGLSNILSAPIKSLTETAESISKGNLTARASVLGNDEFGILGRAFNQMTDQLRTFINELEDRVAQRTSEIARRNEALTYRSRQLQTVAEVARGIVSSQELQTLLDTVTTMISERFGFYHVGIFLLDDNHEYAVLRAANSEGGKRMLARQHMLAVGKVGIVGHVTSFGEPRVATDVGEDSVFFNNPDLQHTRSELALPLKAGDQIIGALDVQSTESNAFSPDDIELFTTLADQVAIAIYNNRLYSATAHALAETQDLHRQYLRQEWSRELLSRPNNSFQYTPKGTSARNMPMKDIESVIQTGEAYQTSEELPDHTLRSIMVVPIILRGETIGVIRVQDTGKDRSWSEDEKQTVQEVAAQVGVALEAARLLEKTVHRAEREKKVLEITGLIRSTNNPQQMLEIAAGELQKALGASRAQIFIRKPTGPLSSNKPGFNGRNEQKEN
jgi:GAF domain-containing protein/HAMP domain-containing protein